MQQESERPVEFDSWLASRSPALTRFAYLMTGNEAAAERALARALTIACATWSRVRRSDDPETQVRRLVVEAHLSPGGLSLGGLSLGGLSLGGVFGRRQRSGAVPELPPASAGSGPPAPSTDAAGDSARAWALCAHFPSPQRAALMLRCYADMTYPQITAAMGGKEMVARGLVEQGFESLRAAVGQPRSDTELEAAFQEAFAAHADDWADVGERAAPAHAGARRRRRRHALAATAVAAVLAVGVAGIALSSDQGSPAAAEDSGGHPSSWRAESYNGIQLWVPSSWGWGEVPRTSSEGLVSCGFEAYSPTAGITVLRYVVQQHGAAPYVGRPVAPRPECRQRDSGVAQHIWFDSPLPLGSDEGQTTVTVIGLSTFKVTVADTNLAERRAILASIERVRTDAHGCPRDAGGIVDVQSFARPEPIPSEVRTLSVCLYGVVEGRRALFYSTRLEGAAARQATGTIESGRTPSFNPLCLAEAPTYRIVLITRTTTASSVFTVNPGRCAREPVGYVTGSGYHVLTQDFLRLWALDGLSLYSSPARGDDRLLPVLPSQ